jgi:tetratricopeptide (TPR) repeat protein/tRNA A-37 threonylcarbamoyl transferase component Bud32
MASERYQQICQLCDDAEEQPPERRAEYLRQACPDTELRAEVEALLAADARASARGFLATPCSETDHEFPPGGAPDREIGRRIGPYEIREVLGHGGMGSVYRAERVEGNYRQTVAIKVIRPDRDGAEVARRFRTERQILAGLKHPNIAGLLYADATPDGQPYLVMDYIDGLPIDRYCRQPGVSIPLRLELIATLCDAVQYAHQRMVIHRDLKPGNILVDAGGQPKILDFGVARVTDPELQATTAQTEAGRIVGTLAYMSPEQVSGRPEDIDTRADIYALGVLCFQLLAGCLPHRLEGKSLPEAIRVIAESEALPLGSVDRALRGDLDTIVAKALARDKAARYGSASELAADIRHFLHDEPITARPRSTLYHLGKFARRNRGLVAAVLAVVVALVLGVIGTSIGLIRARSALEESKRHEALAKETAREARQVVHDSFFGLAGNEELRRPGFEKLRKELLLAAVKHYGVLKELHGDDQELRVDDARAMHNLAQTLSAMGENEAALPFARQVVEFFEAQVQASPTDPLPLRLLSLALNNLSNICGSLNLADEELQGLERALEVSGRIGATSQAMTYTNQAVLWANRNKMARALELFQRAHALWEKAHSGKPDAPWLQEMLATSWFHLGNWHLVAGDLDKADECGREQHGVCTRYVAGSPKNTNALQGLARSHFFLSRLHEARGRMKQALAEQQESSKILEAVWKNSPPSAGLRDSLVGSLGRLAELQDANGMTAEAKATREKRKKIANTVLK